MIAVSVLSMLLARRIRNWQTLKLVPFHINKRFLTLYRCRKEKSRGQAAGHRRSCRFVALRICQRDHLARSRLVVQHRRLRPGYLVVHLSVCDLKSKRLSATHRTTGGLTRVQDLRLLVSDGADSHRSFSHSQDEAFSLVFVMVSGIRMLLPALGRCRNHHDCRPHRRAT